jgi:hypothetical protein
MANLTGAHVADPWQLLNYYGEIFTATPIETPILSMSGGLNGMYVTDNVEFAIDQEYALEAASATGVTETASLTAPNPVTITRTQVKNVTQVVHKSVMLSYIKQANAGRVSGVATSGMAVQPVNEKDFQIAKTLEAIARDMEYTIINGTYVAASAVGVASQTRGLIDAASSTVAAGGAALSKPLMQSLLIEMFGNGAKFRNAVIVCNAFVKTCLTSIYAYAPADRNVGGVNIKQIETDFGNLGVLLHPQIATSSLLIADMPFVKVVSQPVPGKGNFFYEDLAKVGASERGQIFGQWGLDHGPQFMHGTITGLATA